MDWAETTERRDKKLLSLGWGFGAIYTRDFTVIVLPRLSFHLNISLVAVIINNIKQDFMQQAAYAISSISFFWQHPWMTELKFRIDSAPLHIAFHFK